MNGSGEIKQNVKVSMHEEVKNEREKERSKWEKWMRQAEMDRGKEITEIDSNAKKGKKAEG